MAPANFGCRSPSASRPRLITTSHHAPTMSEPKKTDAAVRRLTQLVSSLKQDGNGAGGAAGAQLKQETPTTLRIGSTVLPVAAWGKSPEKVPTEITVDLNRADIRESLAWMAKKEALSQDQFLLGWAQTSDSEYLFFSSLTEHN